MTVSFILGLPQLVGSDFTDSRTFPLPISQTPVSVSTDEISIPPASDIAAWIQVPGRAIETKDISVSVHFLTSSGLLQASLSKEFGFFHTRSSSPQGQNYKIGSHAFKDGFNGALKLESAGSWRPGYDATIVLARGAANRSDSIMLWSAVFSLGTVVLALGIRVLARSGQKAN
ncbi:hypothetical protein HBA55_14200 [Pseudomaricurvus alkylphenolicus]|uniref:hypothetical protein n=1 Tax=Pseudomaricurvus alkylphenolicus TaxID=1306991 RepID=UPI00141FC1C6|nr:hypothetical protein [Pseudomaricurvus alkylphenolicus]NIB40749.1 hypothetical protein [Pseudomaricurvus alkylphenolicus]